MSAKGLGLSRTLAMAMASLVAFACDGASDDPAITPDANSKIASPDSIDGASARRPNFLIIVADDLGYSDIGVFGGEIHTPNIDMLARDGLILRNFYAAGTCSPTRAMLLTGIDHHRAGVGNMMEHIAPNQVGQPGYEGFLNERVATVSERLQKAGYNTYMAGKWHLGMTPETSPAARGFDKSFVLLNGGASHFDQSGLNARTHPAPYREDGKSVDLPSDFDYSTDFYTRRIIDYIESGRESAKPFFAYLAYTAPHWPLQAPAEDIAKYAGVYDEGWRSVQAARLKRMQESGLMPETTAIHPIVTETPAWDALSDEERNIEARKMEIFAAMVDRLDQQIGELIAHLKNTGDYGNTVIVFMSDNGAEGAPLYKLPPFQKWMDRFDNSYENMGAAGSYIYYEERWAQVGMTPFRLYKGMASDGGIHVPAFITYGGFENQGAVYNGLLSVMDIAPTLLELAGLDYKAERFNGRDVYPIQGRSMTPALQSNDGVVRSADEGLGWELFNKLSYRRGNWKAVNMHEPWGTGRWQLYDLSVDPGETNDLADSNREILDELVRAWNEYAELNGVILGDAPPER